MAMPVMDRLKREQRFHDAQAAERARTFAASPERLRFADDEYLDHESWMRPAIARLGPLSGRSVLDWGCGHGMAAVVFARRGANVAACDLSVGYVRETQSRASANRVPVRCLQADAHRLPFGPASFDAIWGHAILHHLEVPRAAAELRRVLRPGGLTVLCEPWGGNPLLRFARRWLPYSHHGHTDDEEPLREIHLKALRAEFPTVAIESFQLFSMVPITRYVVIALRLQ
jgi:ubiquinone/menaquinone biosynthesis C-methylase UbiE